MLNIDSQPKVAVVVVNYKGYKYLEKCFNTLCNQTYANYEIVFVENGGDKKAVEFIKTTYPKVRILESEENLGFTGGYNLGIKYALENLNPDYVAILNNDTWVEKDWLEQLVKGFTDESIGITTSLIYMYYRYLLVEIEAKNEGVVKTIKANNLDYKVIAYDEGFKNGKRFFRNQKVEKGESMYLAVPVDIGQEQKELALKIEASEDFKFGVKIGGTEFEGSSTLKLKIDEILGNITEIVQNGGTLLNKKHLYFFEEHFLEPVTILNERELARTRETEAGCGCAMMIRADLLKSLGMLKEDFFAYFEDTEISYRYFKAGYKTNFIGGAKVHHWFWGVTDDDSFRSRLMRRNRLRFIKEYFGFWRWLWHWGRGVVSF